MGAFITPYDVANVGLQELGVSRITNFSDGSKQSNEASFAYDKVRLAELRRYTWTFATRRAPLRPVTSTIKSVTFPTYSALTTYAQGDIVVYSNVIYSSLIASNLGNTPGVGGFSPAWEVYYGPLQADAYAGGTTYFPGDLAVQSNVLYRYINIASSSGNTPPNATFWMAPTGATLSALFASSPISFDPPQGTTTRQAYKLPANYLRLCAQDPKQPAVARLGTSAGMRFNDWEIESGYLLSASQTGLLILRFVADVQIVTNMEPMFCESVGLRMGLRINETMTKRPDLAARLGQEYARVIDDARAVGNIEGGSSEPDIGRAQPAAPARGNQ